MALKTLLISAAAAALMAGSALAQDTTTGADTGTGTAAQPAPTFTDIRDMTVDDALGWMVYDAGGNRIGEIDYVVEEADGPAAVIGIGGFIGLGEYTVAIPLTDFEIGPEGTSFTLETDKETLKAMPEFDESGVESLPGETRIADLMPADDADDTGSDSSDAGSDTGDAEMESDDTTTDTDDAPTESGDTTTDTGDTTTESGTDDS